MRLITVPSNDPRIRDSSESWRRREQKRLLGIITHTAENDRGEVGKGVDADCAGHEEEGVDPDLPLQQCVQDLLAGDVVVLGVAAVGVKTVLDDLHFFLGEEGTARFVDFVGEVDDEPEADEGECDGDETFDDAGVLVSEWWADSGSPGSLQDPSPSPVAGCAVELVDGVGEEVTKAAGEEVDGVEDCDAFLDLVALVPVDVVSSGYEGKMSD